MGTLNETDSVCHKVAGLLNFLGGNFEKHQIKDMSFSKVIDLLIKNGGTIAISISKYKADNPFFHELS